MKYFRTNPVESLYTGDFSLCFFKIIGSGLSDPLNDRFVVINGSACTDNCLGGVILYSIFPGRLSVFSLFRKKENRFSVEYHGDWNVLDFTNGTINVQQRLSLLNSGVFSGVLDKILENDSYREQILDQVKETLTTFDNSPITDTYINSVGKLSDVLGMLKEDAEYMELFLETVPDEETGITSLKICRSDLTTLTGIPKRRLNRLIANLETKKLLKTFQDEIQIVDPNALLDLALVYREVAGIL